MRLKVASIFLCCISVLYADYSKNVDNCEHENGNCEPFAFEKVSQNLTNTNKSVETKRLKSNELKDLEIIENQFVFEQPHFQENGNLI